jgi:hypothetical protein
MEFGFNQYRILPIPGVQIRHNFRNQLVKIHPVNNYNRTVTTTRDFRAIAKYQLLLCLALKPLVLQLI